MPPSARWPVALSRRWVAPCGLEISYRRAGTGDALILLHGGFGFDSRVWRPQFDELADEFTIVAWDAPGCGGSEDPPVSFRMADYADCLAGFLTDLGLDRAHVLGISFGGALAIALHDRHPTLTRSLILAGAYAGWAGSLPPEEVQRRLRRIAEDITRPPEDWLADYLPGLLTESAPRDMVEHTLALMSGIHPEASLTMLRAMAEADLRDILPNVDVPTLVLHGDLDARAPLAVGLELHERIRGSRLAVLAGVGHLSNVEAAKEFNRAVRLFAHAVRTDHL
ncbi:alpha/beta fold hydrolase [Occultella kanbiaonis]|uniref:alpha/beta fold hydrolase n=1 Tax=Occultella kanbiaonis TaxID=2675754 RepID=UPI0013D46BB8|nr:alpha/beta hydrolase [Occultella kanbiaonis]